MKNINIYAFLAAALWCLGAHAAQNDSTPAGSYLSGQFARNSGDIDGAILSLQEVREENPTNMQVATQLEGLLLLQGKIDEAMAIASDIRRQGDGTDPLAGLLGALHALKEGDATQAAALIDTAASTANPQLWQPLIAAWIDVAKKKPEKPMTIANMGSDIGRAAPLMNYHLALINDYAGFTDEAAKNFKISVEDTRNPPMRVMKMLIPFYERNGQPAILTPIVKAYTESHPMDELQNAPTIATPQDGIAEVLYTMGGIMLGTDITTDAVIYMQLAVYIKPDFEEAVIALGDAYGALEQYARANEAYGRVPVKSSRYAMAQLHIAINYDRLNKLSRSLALLDKLAEQFPKSSDALVTRGDLLRIHGRYSEAVTAYNAALARIPEPKSDDWPILFARGACLEREGKWTAAEADLRQALALKPDQPDVLNYLGYGMLEHKENAPEALALIEQAIKARPNDAEIVDSMGWALYMQGDYKQAAPYLEKAVELMPGDPTVNDHLGDVYWRLGRKTEARFQWERSLTFSPEAKLTDSLRHKLKDGLPEAKMAGTPPDNATP